MLKNLKGILIASVMGLGLLVGSSLTATPANAEVTAGWVYIGGDSITPSTSTRAKTGTVKNSKGGDIRIDVPKYTASNGNNAVLQIDIYEKDEAGNPAEYIGQRKVYGNNLGTIGLLVNVEPYVDGADARAEVYAVYSWNFSSGTVSPKFYD